MPGRSNAPKRWARGSAARHGPIRHPFAWREPAVTALVAALAERDHQVGAHSCRVAPMALRIAAQAGWVRGGPGWLALERAALLHDIGKLAVADAVLRKPAGLSPDEWTEMRRHPEAAFRILREARLGVAAEIVLSHHERWDGLGYPRGLRGEETTEGARILAIADAFDAITSDRPYRSAQLPDYARSEIAAHRGAQFDPRLVDAFAACYDDLVVLAQGTEFGAESAA